MSDIIVSQARPGILSKNITRPVIDESLTGSGTITREFVVTSQAVTAGLLVSSISGTLDVSISTYGGVDPTTATEILSWSNVTSASSLWELKRSTTCLSRIIVTCTYSAAVDFRLSIKPSDNISAETQVVISDTNDGFVTQKITVSTSVVQVTNNSTRRSVGIRNWESLDSTNTLYVKENNTNVTDGWPLAAGEGIALDISENSSVYLATDTGTVDTRILEITKSL